MARWGMEVRVVDKRWLEKTVVTEMTKCYTCWYNLWRGQLHGQVPLMAACECTQRLRTQYRSARQPPCLSNQRSGVAKRSECFTTFFFFSYHNGVNGVTSMIRKSSDTPSPRPHHCCLCSYKHWGFPRDTIAIWVSCCVLYACSLRQLEGVGGASFAAVGRRGGLV